MKMRTVTNKLFFRTGFWKWHAVYAGGKIHTCRILVRNAKKREHLEDLSVYVRIILKWFFRKWNGAGPVMMWVKIGTGCGVF